MIRFFDVFLAIFGLIFLSPLIVLIAIVGWFDNRSPFFRQKRVGRHKKGFIIVKFRTMKVDTAHIASHLANRSAITPLGKFLRSTKLDELPQLWNVLKGDMSLVGPRPCLFNQHELIKEREKRDIFGVRPGITGLAQVNEIDMSTPTLLAETDARMMQDLTVRTYCRYLFMTLMGKGRGDRVQ